MKKLWIALTAAALVAALCATGALAAGHHGRGLRQTAAGTPACGVCDTCGSYFTDADGDGVCDNCGTGCGRYFTDTDGDGVCDNCGTGLGGRHGGRGGCRNP